MVPQALGAALFSRSGNLTARSELKVHSAEQWLAEAMADANIVR